MKPISHQAMLEAAACALVSGRCREAYLHDMRGELQTLHSAVELMARASKGSSEQPGLAEKASSLARRTVASYETSVVNLVEHMTPHCSAPRAVDVGDLVSGIVRFLRNDAARKSVNLALRCGTPVSVSADIYQFRLYLLGLIITTIDELPADSVIDIGVHRSDRDAVIELASNVPCTTVLDLRASWLLPDATLAPYALFLILARQWVVMNGGQLQLLGGTPLPNVLRITYPTTAP